jgi:hypothetical protein
LNLTPLNLLEEPLLWIENTLADMEGAFLSKYLTFKDFIALEQAENNIKRAKKI